MATKVSYGAAAEEVISLFDTYFTGSSNLPFLVIANHEIGDFAEDALDKSLSHLGYATPAYSLILISPDNQPSLDAEAIRLLIEAIDPLRIICVDKIATEKIGSAYLLDLRPNAVNRIMGRSCGIFSDLNSMVQDSTSKYTAWEIFKALK